MEQKATFGVAFYCSILSVFYELNFGALCKALVL